MSQFAQAARAPSCPHCAGHRPDSVAQNHQPLPES